MSHLLLSVMGAFAQFERELIRERQKEGIELAKRAGVYKGRKRTLTPERAAELARDFGVDRVTVYRYIGREAERAAVHRNGAGK